MRNGELTDHPNPSVNRKFGIVEVFAGAAGLAQGFLRTGHFESIALTDVDEVAERTFKLNYSDARYIRCDIYDLTPAQLLQAADGRRIHGVLGGPPCQGYSLAGLKQDDAELNDLVWQYARIVEALDPDFLFLENVPQFLFNRRFNELVARLSKSYQIEAGILNAALYGAPQSRHRGFLLAFHRKIGLKPTSPKPTHSLVGLDLFNYRTREMARLATEEDFALALEVLGADPIITRYYRERGLTWEALSQADLKPIVTVEHALSDLRLIRRDTSTTEQPLSYPVDAQSEYQRECRAASKGVANHEPRRHSTAMVELIRQIPEGGDLRDVDQSRWPKSHYSQAYGRLHRQALARTITTFFCNPGSGRFLHYDQHRTITVREAARLQGFPDTFRFDCEQERQMRLIGNAMPLPLASALANHIYDALAPTLLGSEANLEPSVTEAPVNLTAT